MRRPWPAAALTLALASLAACGSETITQNASSGGGTTGAGASGAGGGSSSATSSSTSSSTAGTTTSATSGSGAGGSGSGQGGGDPGPACSGLSLGAGDHTGTVQSSGEARTYRVHVPPGYDPTHATPVVLVLHGYTQTASLIEDLSQMDPVADAHGFLAVYPQGKGNSWNAGACCGSAPGDGTDDVQLVRDLLDQLATEYCVDDRRVYSSGLSNGGMLSHRLACELSDRIAAIGAVAGTLAIDDCAPPRAVPVLHVHGTADFIVGYDDGGLSGGKGVPETIATWVGLDGCTDATPTTVYQQGDATCTAYTACAEGSAVELCTIDQGGHQWPGGHDDFLGKLSMDLNASETIAQFFEAHPLP